MKIQCSWFKSEGIQDDASTGLIQAQVSFKHWGPCSCTGWMSMESTLILSSSLLFLERSLFT